MESHGSELPPRAVWIDTDTAIGLPGADVDDGLALIQAFHSPELAVCGVGAVFGNAPLDKTFPLARELVERFGPASCPVESGAASAADLGTPNDAVRAMADALREEPMDILALGPVTNVATLLQLHPELAERIRSVVMVAARRPGQRFESIEGQENPFPDFNFECDPDAMQVLLDSDLELVFAPWELSSHVWIHPEDLDHLDADGGATGRYIAQRSRDWLEIWQKNLGAPGFNPFDTLAVAWLTHPDWLESMEGGVWIDRHPEAGRAGEDDDPPTPHLLVDPARAGRRARYCWRPRPEFKPMLLERLSSR